MLTKKRVFDKQIYLFKYRYNLILEKECFPNTLQNYNDIM